MTRHGTRCLLLFLPGIDGSEFHVHIMNRSEDVGGSLDDALAGLRHGNRSASGDQHGLVPRAQRQVRHKVAFDKDHLIGRITSTRQCPTGQWNLTKKKQRKIFFIKCEPIMLSDGNEIVMFFVFVFFYVKTRRMKRKLKENTFWSPNRICLRALRETFMRQRKMRASSAGVTTAWGPAMFALLPPPLPGGRPSSFWTFWWSCLSIISYTLSPWISKSSCENKK